MRVSRRGRMITVTVSVAVVEWVLFEVIRTPYNPPHDMRTLLGQEHYSVFAIMGVIAAGWSLYLLCDGLWPVPQARDCLAFAALLCVIAAVAAAVLFYPPWPVTPFNLLCR